MSTPSKPIQTPNAGSKTSDTPFPSNLPHAIQGVFTPHGPINGVFTPKAPSTNRPEALHEIGLTLSEVDEVLRRRASLSLRLDDPPTPCPRKAQKDKQARALFDEGNEDGAADSMPGYRFFAAAAAAEEGGAAFRSSIRKHHGLHPISIVTSQTNITSPYPSPSSISISSSSSDGSGVLLNDYHSFNSPDSDSHSFTSNLSTAGSSPVSSVHSMDMAHSFDTPNSDSHSFTSNLSTAGSSPASSVHSMEMAGPLQSMAMTIKRLEDRVQELEEKFQDLEGEVGY
ncbi:MAG: hypothetical protein Q9168_006180 [Polycauliona sp. 1 TL-2023]